MNYQLKKCLNLKQLSILALFVVSNTSQAHIPKVLPPDFSEPQLNSLVKTNKVTELDELAAKLPQELRLNFVLKHGVKRQGERGHLVETKVSQSSDPDLPRVILWNERTGFSVSYNGGSPAQTANGRVDILSFNQTTKSFVLSAIDFPLTEEQLVQNGASVVKNDASCQECHGPRQRPIFAMYPDWPAFYGSDNDELNNPAVETQTLELSDYRNFRSNMAPRHARYSPLFSPELVRSTYGMPIWETYPYRPDTSTKARNISRSFVFRPGLRLGIVYNRLQADSVFKSLKDHPNYDKVSLLALHSLLECDWNPKFPKTLEAMKISTASFLQQAPQFITGLQLNYHQIWQLFGLQINDIDIRYSYNHEGYRNMDASLKIMEPGYIGRYFNAYFDGTATIDELVAGKLLTDLSLKYPALKSTYRLHGLVEKYRKFEARFSFDESTFQNYDRLGMWFPIPYAAAVFERQHRETYTNDMKLQHQNVCLKTSEIMRDQFLAK